MKAHSNSMTGSIYSAVPDSKVNHENLFKELKRAKEYDSEPFKLSFGNVFNNEKALPKFPNQIVIFEIDFNDNDYYPSNFRGFLFPDGSVNGKIKYSIDAKCADGIFDKGIFKISKKGELIIFGYWSESGEESPFFIELESSKMAAKKN